MVNPMAKQIYDVIVIGTGAGGGMAIKALCEAGLKVCALNSGRAIDPEKDFRNHRMPWDLKYRGFGDPKLQQQSVAGFVGDTEYVQDVWERELTHTTAPGTRWSWPRCSAVGGRTSFWGRSAERFGDIDFRAGSLDQHDVDWPVTYEEIAPYYTQVEKMIGVASTVQNRPSNPDGAYLPPMNFRCFDRILEAGAKKLGVPYLPDRIAQLTVEHEGHPACHFCGDCTSGCEVGAFFSTSWFLLPSVHRSPKQAGAGSLRARGGHCCFLPCDYPHHAELKVPALARGYCQLQRAARAQPLRSPLWHPRRWILTPASRPTQFPRQRF
jgi:choline dehydrogenase-like flavoprotein